MGFVLQLCVEQPEGWTPTCAATVVVAGNVGVQPLGCCGAQERLNSSRIENLIGGFHQFGVQFQTATTGLGESQIKLQRSVTDREPCGH